MSERPPGELLVRNSSVTGVNLRKRLVELVVIPYDEEALVEMKGVMVKESVAPGAFAGIEQRPNRVKANRDHKVERTVGKAVAFHPSREEGLVAEVKIADTVLGEETLSLIDDEILGASAGYLPMPDGATWLTRSRVRMERCWLGHIALVPEPAYTGAKVLAVRQKTDGGVTEATETPNLDVVRGWLMDERYERLRAEL